MTGKVADYYKIALNLEYFTLVYNFFEALASLFFGSAAGSIALVGFGLDSIIESLSGLVLIWRLRKHEHLTAEKEEHIEKKALLFIAITFFILGFYVMYESVLKLYTREIASASVPGMVIALLSLVVMPVLAWKKRSVGTAIGSKALIADSKETLICALMSFALISGLAANYFLGFWQADPLTGLIITLFLFREGYELWQDTRDGPDQENLMI